MKIEFLGDAHVQAQEALTHLIGLNIEWRCTTLEAFTAERDYLAGHGQLREVFRDEDTGYLGVRIAETVDDFNTFDDDLYEIVLDKVYPTATGPGKFFDYDSFSVEVQ